MSEQMTDEDRAILLEIGIDPDEPMPPVYGEHRCGACSRGEMSAKIETPEDFVEAYEEGHPFVPEQALAWTILAIRAHDEQIAAALEAEADTYEMPQCDGCDRTVDGERELRNHHPWRCPSSTLKFQPDAALRDFAAKLRGAK